MSRLAPASGRKLARDGMRNLRIYSHDFRGRKILEVEGLLEMSVYPLAYEPVNPRLGPNYICYMHMTGHQLLSRANATAREEGYRTDADLYLNDRQLWCVLEDRRLMGEVRQIRMAKKNDMEHLSDCNLRSFGKALMEARDILFRIEFRRSHPALFKQLLSRGIMDELIPEITKVERLKALPDDTLKSLVRRVMKENGFQKIYELAKKEYRLYCELKNRGLLEELGVKVRKNRMKYHFSFTPAFRKALAPFDITSKKALEDFIEESINWEYRFSEKLGEDAPALIDEISAHLRYGRLRASFPLTSNRPVSKALANEGIHTRVQLREFIESNDDWRERLSAHAGVGKRTVQCIEDAAKKAGIKVNPFFPEAKSIAKERYLGNAKSLLLPFVKHEDYSDEERARCAERLSQLVYPRGTVIGRPVMFHALRELGVEPVDMRDGALGEIIPEALPRRTAEEAWALVKENLGLIPAVWKSIWRPYHVPMEDQDQEAAIYLFYLALAWDSSRSKLSHYVSSNFHACKTQIIRKRTLLRTPGYVTEAVIRYRILISKNKLSRREAAEQMGLSEEGFQELRLWDAGIYSTWAYPDVYNVLDGYKLERLRRTQDDELVPRLKINFADDVFYEMLPEVEKDYFSHELAQTLERLLSGLTQREQRILRQRFGLDGGEGATLEEIGMELNVTRERVRQIESKALDKLRHPSRVSILKAFRYD